MLTIQQIIDIIDQYFFSFGVETPPSAEAKAGLLSLSTACEDTRSQTNLLQAKTTDNINAIHMLCRAGFSQNKTIATRTATTLQTLLSSRVDANTKQNAVILVSSSQRTALHDLCCYGFEKADTATQALAAVKALLGACRDEQRRQELVCAGDDNNQWTALYLLCCWGFRNADTAPQALAAVNALLGACRDKQRKEKLVCAVTKYEQQTALHELCCNGFEKADTAPQALAAVKALLGACRDDQRRQALVCAVQDAQWTALHLLCRNGFEKADTATQALATVNALLGACRDQQRRQALVCAVNNVQWTALHFLCRHGFGNADTAAQALAAVNALLAACRDEQRRQDWVCAVNSIQCTALHLLCCCGFQNADTATQALAAVNALLEACRDEHAKQTLVLAVIDDNKTATMHFLCCNATLQPNANTFCNTAKLLLDACYQNNARQKLLSQLKQYPQKEIAYNAWLKKNPPVAPPKPSPVITNKPTPQPKPVIVPKTQDDSLEQQINAAQKLINSNPKDAARQFQQLYKQHESNIQVRYGYALAVRKYGETLQGTQKISRLEQAQTLLQQVNKEDDLYEDVEEQLSSLETELNQLSLGSNSYSSGDKPLKALTTVQNEQLHFSDTVLGEGAIGKVYKGQWKQRDVAIKQLQVKSLKGRDFREFTNETYTMINFDSPFLVKCYDYVATAPHYCLVMEYMALGSLYDLLHDSSQDLTWYLRVTLMSQIAHGIQVLHEHNYIHRDLKSLNVLVTMKKNKMCAKLSDFGQSKIKDMSSRMTTRTQSGVVGTIHWSAPELIQFDKPSECTKATDIYAFGMILWEICTRLVPFMGIQRDILGILIAQGKQENIASFEKEKPGAANLIRLCWSKHPSDRPTIQKAIQHLSQFSQTQAPPTFSGEPVIKTLN